MYRPDRYVLELYYFEGDDILDVFAGTDDFSVMRLFFPTMREAQEWARLSQEKWCSECLGYRITYICKKLTI